MPEFWRYTNMINIANRNDTGLHPRSGYILAEVHIIPPANGQMILIPDAHKKDPEPTEETHRVHIIEDANGTLAVGTRILCTGRNGFKHCGRNLLLLKDEEVVAWYDKE